MSRVLIIGLDGGTLDLIGPWAAAGRLPNLARLMREGAHGRLRSVPNRNSAAAWSSIVTGTNPGKHGIFWFIEYQGYEYTYINASYRDAKAIWRLLSDAGRPVVVMNVPMSYPAEPVNGVLIAGFDGPGLHDPRFAYPEGVVDDLRTHAGDYTVEVGMPGHVKAGRYEQALSELHEAIEQRYRWAHYLLTTRPWEFGMVVFRETDPVQHFFWKYMAPDGFGVMEEEVGRYGRAIPEVYEHLDEVIGRLLALVGPETTVIVLSDHGAGPDSGKARSLQRWLQTLGLLHFRGQTSGTHALRRRVLNTLFAGIHVVDKRLSRETKAAIAHRFPWLRRRAKVLMSYAHIDWERTRAFSDGKRPDIWINLRGRQPKGIVEPGEEYDRLCRIIREKFTSARSNRDGRPVVHDVYRRDEVYHGPHVDKSPDLIVEWVKGAVADSVVFDDGTVVRLRGNGAADPMERLVCGGHEPDGIVFLAGAHVRPGAVIDGATVMDIVPTVLYLLGEPIPPDVDGVVLRSALDEQLLQRRAAVEAGPAAGGRRPEAYAAEDEAVIRDRLRGLGYVD